MYNKIFLSYNPNTTDEQLARQLYRTALSYGFKVLLPDRNQSSISLSETTKERIAFADWFIIFSTKALSPIVRQEINYALSAHKEPSQIVVLFPSSMNINDFQNNNFTFYKLDRSKRPFEADLKYILNDLYRKNQIRMEKDLQKEKEENAALKTILGIGLGLLLLNSLSK